MPKLLGTKRTLLGDTVIKWLLRDDFNDTRAAGSVTGTLATPGPGTRTVVDTNSKLSIGSGTLSVVTGSSGSNDPRVYYEQQTRVAGLLMVTSVNIPTAEGFRTALSRLDIFPRVAFLMFDGIWIYADYEDADISLVGGYSTSTQYYVGIVLRTAGTYYFIKGGAFTNWTLLFPDNGTRSDDSYPMLSAENNVCAFDVDFIRVPVETWLPTPFAYETFTDDNGTSLDAHASDTSGPDSQPVTSQSWTEESGDWDIQSNKANPDGAGIATVDVGVADVLVELVVDGGAAEQPGIVLRFTDTSNYWYLQADRANNQLELHEVNATVDNVRANIAVTINDSTDYVLTAICYGTTITGYLDSSNYITYASASLNETATEHGLYSDNTACEFDNFLIFPRDIGYSSLDKFTR